MSDPTNTTTPAAPEWAEKVMMAILDTSRHGRGDGRLTIGEQQMLDYLFLAVRQRAGLLSDRNGPDRLPWAEVITGTWKAATATIEAEQAARS